MQPLRLEEKRAEYDGGFVILPNHILRSELSDRAVRLYAELIAHANNETGVSWPSRERLAKLLRCSVNSVKRAARELEKANLIERRARDGLTNHWVVLCMARGGATHEPGTRPTSEPGGGPPVAPRTIPSELDPLEPEPMNQRFASLYEQKRKRK